MELKTFVSERIIALVGNKMKTFRNDLMEKKSKKFKRFNETNNATKGDKKKEFK